MITKKKFDFISLTIIFQFIFMFFLGPLYRNSITVMISYTIINFLVFLIVVYLTKKRLEYTYLLFLFAILVISFIHIIFFKYSIWIETLILLNFYIIFYYFKTIVEEGYSYQVLFVLKLTIVLFLIFSLFEGFVKNNVFIEKFGGESIVNELIRTRYTANYLIRGTMEHPLIISFFCIFITPFIFLFDNKILRNFLIALVIFTSFVTYKRTSMVLVLVLVVLGYTGRIIFIDKEKFPASKIFKIFLVIIVMGLLVMFVPISGETLFERIYNQFMKLETYNRYSIIHRSSSIRLGLEHFFKSNVFGIFFGNGYRSLSNYFLSNSITISVDGFYVIDNSYLTMLNDFGLVGIFTFLILSIKSLFSIYRRFKSSREKKNKFFYCMISLSLIFCLSHIFFFDFMNWFQPIFCFALLLGYSESKVGSVLEIE
ncbi:oligosaccharide repeat unit polymerase [Enterococcus casseliflavus]|uniref:O-antigen polymerase n=1 Tax=Enterococcus casseliflavus TaxID=37734 RepID=UPI002DB75382|nr:O-antigen polymerase [Enterococcus casseliflavus]MEB6087863.1 oligosaccharide repeat unit polymerase [Enterococcus casseliflavus]